MFITFLYERGTSWKDAHNFCQRHNRLLLVIENKIELQGILMIGKRTAYYKFNSVLIGLSLIYLGLVQVSSRATKLNLSEIRLYSWGNFLGVLKRLQCIATPHIIYI